MKKVIYCLLPACLAVSMFACSKSETKTSEKTPSVDSATAVQVSEPAVASKELKGDYCFQSATNRDTTTIRVRILSQDDIRGEMIWNPWQKDGAVGSLIGKLNADNEMELIYDYTIEGSRQSEMKIMKIENDRIMIKEGELIDPNNDGKLVFKDVKKAVYKETLTKISCQ